MRRRVRIAAHRNGARVTYLGHLIGECQRLSSGGVLYLAGWTPDLFEPVVAPPGSRRVPACLRRDRGPFRCERALADRLEALCELEGRINARSKGG